MRLKLIITGLGSGGRMNLRLNANAVVTNEEGKILLVELKGGPYKGGLSIPGGGIEPGEMSFNAAKREVMEETGVSIEKFEPFGFCELVRTDIGKHRVVILLEGKGEGEPKETEEAMANWFDLNEVNGKLIPFAEKAIKIWQEGKRYFCLVDDGSVKNDS